MATETLPAAELGDLLTRYQEAHNDLGVRTASIEAARSSLRSLSDLLREGRLPKMTVDGGTVSVSVHQGQLTYDGDLVQTLAADIVVARERREELAQIILDLGRAGFTRFNDELAEHHRALGLRRL